MAIYHLSFKTISRSAGRSATAAAAYRSGTKIEDEATGEIHDYRRKQGVEAKMLVLPSECPEWATSRAKLWNKAEAAETRKNSTVAREIVIALPAELTHLQRKQLAGEFALEIASRHQCVADVAIHRPDIEGNDKNFHAHILLTTRRMTREGFSEKTRELDDRKTGPLYVKHWRERFAVLQNQHLEAAGHSARVDHRTLEAQGIDRVPTKHLGVHAKAIERRTGQFSRRRLQHNEEATRSILLARAIGEIERSMEEIQAGLIVLNRDQVAEKAAQAKREQTEAEQAKKAQDEALFKSRADAIRSNADAVEIVKKHPELAGAIAALRAIELQVEKEALTTAQRGLVMQRVRENLAASLEKGNLPKVEIKEEKQVEGREERDRGLER